ncbi:DNA topoisomerase I [Candidatus Roizmanbacteria bacterium RIFCSPHIGHO2_02_FULL_37_15]|uniref:DNA topoisomerase 1 n=1 Tax=Candidatus Roizmanbacteria bacterium RIFCSPLOWO2_01_FULL_37_16 TaxID=1802058 RepID=A0A1F7IKM0_9BACT|nr:MAG: DNA topoisomerase I [Candidatus Roizmanbacteria bacterium RIFCSPHIGHO2_01_FULL_37_16b]OGK20477.1 MAG: DNA topoisomerase I [Candidatus Roizmanbacteria bacterium RIFCSPHIGHO2_02_FULL_37_15]OGK31744.1 MAG: DNA topoisomerase I [Candidatus Roizmanbacteria bacterium RIFCSPHIGHO2_12_FULL_36_11]OGK43904.1 MAG: DNA topoisomerase I [Candidatus Roizmanbacteria bacterium RIFCSPLOWO2_01_FULL_37_16]
MALIIVESPTKARTFNRIIKDNKNFVFATMGHIRDLPPKRISIDYKNKFKPTYEIIAKKRKVVAELKKLAKENKEIILATDPDREGESIAYHAAYLTGHIKEKWPNAEIIKNGLNLNLQRIIFHEITPRALKEALEKPEKLRLDLVYAQQARRILDRIVGYELSPLLWKKIGKNWLSAGRVQTVVLRLIVEREKEIKNFKIEDYYQIFGFFEREKREKDVAIKAKLISKDDILYEQKFSLSLFAGDYQYSKTTINGQNVDKIKKDLEAGGYDVSEIKEEIQHRYPPPPFTTSLLSQDSFYKFGFSSKMTMRLAQDLYERGLITYHRTDSFNLSTQFVFKAKDYILENFGKDYALDKPRGYKTRSKMAQEAHEAIRPTKLDPSAAESGKDQKITINHKKLYKLIFNRAIATQMKEASIKHHTITILSSKAYLFESELQLVIFDGFLKILNPEFVKRNKVLPDIKKDDSLRLISLDTVENQTKPPPRYNEATLIKTLEEKGIGRPSTYAPIISLIQEKNYVEKENRYFMPTRLGETISEYLAKSFPNIFDLNFTAKMEEELDLVADGKIDTVRLLQEFNSPFQKDLSQKKKDDTKIDVEEEIKEICPSCGSPLVVRYSKFGKFIGCSNYPKCKFTKPYLKFIPNKICPEDGGRVVLKFSKKRKRFFGCENYPKCTWSAWKLTK